MFTRQQRLNWWRSLTPKQREEYAIARRLADRMNAALDVELRRVLDAAS